MRTYKKYLQEIADWNDQREVHFFKIYNNAEVVVTIPSHMTGFRLRQDGNVTYDGNMLNFNTLRDMLGVMLLQEESRREYSVALKNHLNDLAMWERTHPVPQPPNNWWNRLWTRKRSGLPPGAYVDASPTTTVGRSGTPPAKPVGIAEVSGAPRMK